MTIAILAVFLYLQNNWAGLTKLEIVSEKLPGNFEGFKIVQLSDLHSKSFGKDQTKLQKILVKVAPDIIVITGDLIDSKHYDEQAALALVERAVELAPVYFVTGNHEWWSGKFVDLERKLKATGAHVLRNGSRELVSGEQKIYITGIDDPTSTTGGYNQIGYMEDKLHETIPLLPQDGFKVLLSHRPEAFNQYSSYGVDLVFSGHAHGGQVRLPFVGGLAAPDQGFFPRYTAGIYRDGNTAMVVSRGLGNSIAPLRLFNRPEVVLVTLRMADVGNRVDMDGTKQANVLIKRGANEQTSTDEKQLIKSEKQSIKSEKQSFINGSGKTVEERILVPEGFERIKVEPGSFGEYLRKLPLKPHGSKVLYYNGDTKPGDVHEAVLDIDVGERDLQQCADSIIRLRAEYLYEKGHFEQIHFNFTNGFKADYSTWMKGNRIKVSGNKAYWVEQGSASKDYSSFRKYLDIVFAYAGTLSLSMEMKKMSVDQMQPGDVFMYGHTPGHCEIVLDMVENKETGEKLFIVAQGYMPAQDMHILKNPANESGNPWYSMDFGEKLSTPEWVFSKDQLMRFEEYILLYRQY